MEKTGLGFVGLGRWARILADGFTGLGTAEIVAAYGRTTPARDDFCAGYGCRASESYDELLADPQVEGVVIVTPHSTHATLIEEAASAGKHVFVEKPLTAGVADAKRAVAAAEQAGIVLQVGHNRRRQPANRRVKAMIDAGELGVLRQLEGNQSSAEGHWPTFPEWRKDPAECPGGGLSGPGVHMVDTFQYLVGPSARLFAFSKPIDGRIVVDEATGILIEYESGPIGYIGTSYLSPKVTSLAAFGTDAIAWSEEEGEKLYVQHQDETIRSSLQVEVIDTVADEADEFIRCIREGAVPETGGREGLEVVAIMEATALSAATGKPVDMGELRSS